MLPSRTDLLHTLCSVLRFVLGVGVSPGVTGDILALAAYCISALASHHKHDGTILDDLVHAELDSALVDCLKAAVGGEGARCVYNLA